MTSVNGKKVLKELTVDEIPKWLNDDFFAHIIHNKNCGADAKVKVVSVKPAVAAGENFIASILRVGVEVEQTKYAFILKHANDNFVGLSDIPVWPKEKKMYSEIIPALENEFKRIGEEVQFGPKCHLTTHDPVDIIVFDDLNANGYSVKDRLSGLDLNHAKVLLAKLAKFHAASAVYNEKNAAALAEAFPTPYEGAEFRKIYAISIAATLKTFLEGVRSSSILEPLADKIEKWEHSAFDEILRTSIPDPDGFNVLNHGDTWITNYLFSYDENEQPNDALLIDYQVSYWASPTIDLYYFLVSSTNCEIKNIEFDNLIQFYHAELVTNLVKLGYSKKVPTLRELHIDLLKNGFVGPFNCYMIMSVALLDPTEDANVKVMLSDTQEGDAVRRSMYHSPRFIRHLEKILPFLDRRGLLEI